MAEETGLLEHPTRLESKLRLVPYALDVWCPLLRSAQLARSSVCRAEFAGKRLAVFRDAAGAVGAVIDRCPHRGVELSLGRVRGDAIQCAYHGWKVDRCGTVVSAPGVRRMDPAPTIEAFEVRERHGVVWIFVGEQSRAAAVPLPDLAPFGSPASVDILMSKEVRAHWSLVLDNALDLFHHHLHRDIPIFFRIESLQSFGSDGTAFHVHYKARMSSHYGRRRRGDLRLRATDNVFTLDLNGLPIIHSVSTPRSADGRRLTAWYFIACPGGPLHRALTAMLRPLLKHQISRAFDQDVMILESEQRALDGGLRHQNELNPVVLAAHAHYAERVRHLARSRMATVEVTPLHDAAALLAEARAGTLAILAHQDGELGLLDPIELAQLLSRNVRAGVARYASVALVLPDGPGQSAPSKITSQ